MKKRIALVAVWTLVSAPIWCWGNGQYVSSSNTTCSFNSGGGTSGPTCYQYGFFAQYAQASSGGNLNAGSACAYYYGVINGTQVKENCPSATTYYVGSPAPE